MFNPDPQSYTSGKDKLGETSESKPSETILAIFDHVKYYTSPRKCINGDLKLQRGSAEDGYRWASRKRPGHETLLAMLQNYRSYHSDPSAKKYLSAFGGRGVPGKR